MFSKTVAAASLLICEELFNILNSTASRFWRKKIDAKLNWKWINLHGLLLKLYLYSMKYASYQSVIFENKHLFVFKIQSWVLTPTFEVCTIHVLQITSQQWFFKSYVSKQKFAAIHNVNLRNILLKKTHCSFIVLSYFHCLI